MYVSIMISERVGENEFEVAVADAGSQFFAIFLKFVAVSVDEVGAILNAEVERLVLEAYTNLPAHLEAVPGVFAAIHCLFTFIEAANPLAIFLFAIGVFIFGFVLRHEVEFEVYADIGFD